MAAMNRNCCAGVTSPNATYRESDSLKHPQEARYAKCELNAIFKHFSLISSVTLLFFCRKIKAIAPAKQNKSIWHKMDNKVKAGSEAEIQKGAL